MIDGFKHPAPRQPPQELPQPQIQPQPPLQPQLPPQQPPQLPQEVATPSVPTPAVAPVVTQKPSKLRSRRRWWLWLLCAVIGLFIALLACYGWYVHALTPVSPKDHTVQQVQVGDSASFSFVSGRLQERGLIRSALALRIYATIHKETNDLKQGACNLLPSESAIEILHKLTAGCNDFKVVTFYPGATIERPLPIKPGSKDFSVRGSLEQAGFSPSDITAALNASYDSPLFADKPAGTSLEGYVYGDTYFVNIDAGPAQALKDAFSEMEKVVEQNDLVTKFKAHGMTLYQGITLASIVQRELSCDNLKQSNQAACDSNQQKVAQVFYSRIQQSMPLGSDVTFIYAAGLTGETASSRIDSPYNTYIHTGLTPGPISSPGELALNATANPASTDYLYFVAGDEGGGAVYFGKTQAEHEQNIKAHCQVLCSAG